MWAVKIAELTSILILVIFVLGEIFQVLVPLIRGTPFFPILRHKPQQAVKKLTEAVEQKGVQDIEKAATDLLRNATTKRSK
jgi:hypothetical protein